jgi:CD109 antigen
LTERIQNNTNSIILHKYLYKIELVKTADAFKPGMPYTAYLKVAYQDDMPVQDDLNQVSVKWGFTSNPDTYNVTEYKIPEDGIIELKFDTPLSSSIDVLGIEASYKDLTQWFSSIPRALSDSDNYIQARLSTLNPQVGQNVRIEIESTEKFDTLTYLIFGRGKLAFAETLRASSGTRNELNFRATSDMSPRCRVIVYYVRELTGEIVADALDFEVAGALTNFVDIWANRKSQFPGSDITINIKTKPSSFVGIMAVDRSVRSLKAGHDIIESDVLDELRGYDSAKLPSFFPWFKVIEPKEGSLYWYTGASASRQVFQESGAVILSNGQLKRGRSSNANVQVQHHGENRPFGRPLPRPDVDTLNPDQGPGVEYESATRPPLAGPYAFSRLPRPVDNLPKVYLKNDLPPTWLFANTTTDLDGLAALDLKTPELANTSWIISGFSLDNLHGMGISTKLQQLEIFQPFFVKVDLPYSVKQGETVAVQMIVYNYLEREISAEVTLENPGGKSFVFGSKNPNEVVESNEIELFRTKRVSVKPGRGTLISFIITPQEIGLIDMKITAKSGSVGQDVQIKKLLVEAEGEVMYNNTAILLDLRRDQDQEFNFTLDIPKTAVKNSEKIYISAVVDPAGPAMNNLKNLINYPIGCGEQNMIRIVPGVILSQYLESIGQLKGQLQRDANKLMEDGYQRQLAYKLRDGSFSAFGEIDRRGSVWVTALVARYFQQASQFIDIDPKVVQVALDWLVEQQKGDGSFSETGRIIDARIQEDKPALTAFVSLAFLDNRFSIDLDQRNAMNKAISFLAESFSGTEDPYVLAIITYVLYRAEHPLKDQAFQLLNSYIVTEGDKKYWETQLEGFEKENPWTSMPNSANIQMTAYGLMTMLLRNEFDESMPVVRWLLSQQNENGGFASTTDTYSAILALKEFSTKARIPERGSDINIQYTYLQTVRRMQVNNTIYVMMPR